MDNVVLEYLKKKQENVNSCGDMNVVHKDYDIHDKTQSCYAGLYRSERQAFDNIEAGYLDIWRYRNPTKFNIHGGIHDKGRMLLMANRPFLIRKEDEKIKI